MPLKSATPRLNIYGPRADKLVFAPHLATGSGTDVFDLATASGALGNAVADAAITWGSDADGPYLDGAGQVASGDWIIKAPDASGDYVLPEYTLMIEFSNVGDNTTARPLFSTNDSTSINSAHCGIYARWLVSADTIRITWRDQKNAINYAADFTGRDRTAKHVLFIGGGPGGAWAELDGTAPDATSGTPANWTGGLRTISTEAMVWGINSAGTEYLLGRVHNTAIWRCRLSTSERARLYADAALMTRSVAGLAAELAAATARADTDYTVGQVRKFATGDYLYECTTAGNTGVADPTAPAHDATAVNDGTAVWTSRIASIFFNPWGPCWQGRPTTTTFSWLFTTSPWLQSTSVKVRVKYAAAGSDPYSGTAVTSDEVTTARTTIVLTATGLSSGTNYDYIAEWSVDNGATWYSFPCGLGHFQTQGSAAQEPTWAAISDCHFNHPIQPSDLGWGDANVFSSGTTVDTHTSSRRRYAISKASLDLMEQGRLSFLIWGGDHIMFNADPILDTNDYTSDKLQRARSFMGMYTQLIVRQANFFIPGNHEGETGNKQEFNSTSAQQKQAFNTRLLAILNPDGSTYAQGGESANTAVNWVWPDSSSPDFLHSQAVHLQNYWAFEWGSGLFVFLDSLRYSGANQANGATHPYYVSPESASLGSVQRDWLRTTLAGSSKTIKMVFAHTILGGIFAGQNGGDDIYFRGIGRSINAAEPYASEGIAEGSEERTVHSYLRQYGVTLYCHGHDHKYARAAVDGVTYMSLPTAAAFANSNNNPGWNIDTEDASRWDEVLDEYEGADAYYNTMGYVWFQIAGGALTHKVRVTHYYTVGAAAAENVVTKFSNQFDAAIGQYPERFISDVAHTPTNASGRNDVTLATGDALNTSPLPISIYGAYLSSAITGTWYTGAVTQRLGQAVATQWAASTNYAAGDYVYPKDRRTGYLYRATTDAGSSGGTEPTFTGAATDWPVIVGATVVDGGITWTCVQAFDPQRPYDTRLPAGATVAVTTSSDVKVAYAPRWIHSQTMELNSPEAMSGGVSQARRMARHGRRKIKQ